jgi:hypothetical protein
LREDAIFTAVKRTHRWFAPVVEFMIERLIFGSIAGLIVYGGCRMFML